MLFDFPFRPSPSAGINCSDWISDSALLLILPLDWYKNDTNYGGQRYRVCVIVNVSRCCGHWFRTIWERSRLVLNGLHRCQIEEETYTKQKYQQPQKIRRKESQRNGANVLTDEIRSIFYLKPTGVHTFTSLILSGLKNDMLYEAIYQLSSLQVKGNFLSERQT